MVTQAETEIYDIVIRGGRVLDGAGNPWIAADIAISNGKLVKIGRVTGSGHREIDATGQYVSPGYLPILTWMIIKNSMVKILPKLEKNWIVTRQI